MNCENCNVELNDDNRCTCNADATHCKNHHPDGEAAPAGEDAGQDMA